MFELRSEQQAAVDWMRGREEEDFEHAGGILADDVGKGKTYTVAGLLDQVPRWPVLVVVPKTALTDWVSVLLSVPKQRRLWVIDGDAPESAYSESLTYDLVLASHSCFTRGSKASERLRSLTERGWGRVIVDEAQVIKNPDTIIHRTLRSIPASARWALTATPVQNSKNDLLALARFISVETNDTDFVRDRYVLLRSNAVDDLPPLRVLNVALDLSHPEERALYETVRADHEEGLKELVASSGLSGATKNMERVLRCMQACTHPALYWRSLAQRRTSTDEDVLAATRNAEALACCRSTKLTFIADDLQKHADAEKSIVFCNFLGEMDILCALLVERGVRYKLLKGSMDTWERREAVQDFKDDEDVRAFVVQIQCAGCALNLQCASRVYFVRPQWNPAVEAQAIGRPHRSGQTRAVTVMRVLAKGTVDEAILRRCGDKLAAVTETLRDSAMQRRLEGRQTDASLAIQALSV